MCDRRGKGFPAAAVLTCLNQVLGTSTAALDTRAPDTWVQIHCKGTEENLPWVTCSHKGAGAGPTRLCGPMWACWSGGMGINSRYRLAGRMGARP